MNFAQAQNYLVRTINETVSRREPYRLDRMRALLRELDNPQDRYPTVHVGGTSGKGSTSTMIASVLTAAGKRTGLHTKPHLHSLVERARIDGTNISEERFGELLDEMMPAIERTNAAHGRPSYYETVLALAFLHFMHEAVDAAVIEVGIGGKLDGTNVIVPQVCVITNVGLDHTDVLGDTLEKIAADKAGIAKHGVPLISAVEDAGPRAVIESACAAAGAPFISVLDETRIQSEGVGLSGQRLRITTAQETYAVALPLLGTFQTRNAATAILALERLPEGLRPDRSAIELGLSRVLLPGRMEYFSAHPALVFDVAHNPDKAAHLAASLLATFPDRRFSFVIAVTESKDAREILRAFAELPASFIFTSFDTEGRTANRPQRLGNIAEELGMWGRAVADPVEALSIARRNSGADDVVVVTGSTFVVAELRKWWIDNVLAAPDRALT